MHFHSWDNMLQATVYFLSQYPPTSVAWNERRKENQSKRTRDCLGFCVGNCENEWQWQYFRSYKPQFAVDGIVATDVWERETTFLFLQMSSCASDSILGMASDGPESQGSVPCVEFERRLQMTTNLVHAAWCVEAVICKWATFNNTKCWALVTKESLIKVPKVSLPKNNREEFEVSFGGYLDICLQSDFLNESTVPYVSRCLFFKLLVSCAVIYFLFIFNFWLSYSSSTVFYVMGIFVACGVLLGKDPVTAHRPTHSLDDSTIRVYMWVR